MSISRDDFKNAFREVVSAEFSHIPDNEDDIDYTFSERFNKRMARLIKSQRKSYWVLVNTAAKRAAVVVVAILTLFTAAFSVKAIREPVIRFIKQVYETFTRYTYEGDMADEIAKEYVLTYLPDGFEQTSKTENDVRRTMKYENTAGDYIVFSQRTTKINSGWFIDVEQGDSKIETINGIGVQFYESSNVKFAMWLQDGYVFSINCYGEVSLDEIKEMITSIE